MTIQFNHLGQPIGFPVPDWTPPPVPSGEPMEGRYCRVEPLDMERHGRDLFEANSADGEARMWTYLPYGPFTGYAQYQEWGERVAGGHDPFFHAIVNKASGKAVGVASYLRIDPESGSLEVGHIAYAPALQRTPAATEAMFLLMQRAFTLGYRRYEWKCDALNAQSRAAAQRLGFSFEGVFRQARVYRSRNRDTAWYACIDQEWPALRQAFEQWLEPSNFAADGQQRHRLSDLTAPILKQHG